MFNLLAYRVFGGATCSESLEGLSLVFYSLFAIFLFAIIMVSSQSSSISRNILNHVLLTLHQFKITLRSALYKIKVQLPNQTVRGESIPEECDEDDLERFYHGQVEGDSGGMTIKEKPSGETHTSDSIDEENGFGKDNANAFEVEVLSIQSSIDTNEDFNDDGVNSYNEELEPLTPSPKMKGNPRRRESILSPTCFQTSENKENLLSIEMSSEESAFPHTPKKTSNALRRMKASKKDGRKNYLNLG